MAAEPNTDRCQTCGRLARRGRRYCRPHNPGQPLPPRKRRGMTSADKRAANVEATRKYASFGPSRYQIEDS